MIPIRILFVCCMFTFVLPSRAAADVVPGVDWYAENAEVAALVVAESDNDAKAFPPPRGQQRVIVREILKGFETRQTWLIPAGTLKSGLEAILLKPYHPPVHYEQTLQSKRLEPESGVILWPIVDGNVLTGDVPAKTGGFGLERGPITLKEILDELGRPAPEEMGLTPHVLTAWLFPDKLETVIGKNRERIDYVRYVAILRDLERDVAGLTNLLESPDRKIRDAAIKKLRAITQTDVTEPKDDKPASLHAWSQVWRTWWEQNRDGLYWDSAKAAWLPRLKDQPSARNWPAVPANFERTPDAFPADLLLALDKKDRDAFAVAFRKWLDSGVMRDRQVKLAEQLAQKLKQDNKLEGAMRYLPPVPRVHPDVLFRANLSLDDRAKILALVAHQWHFDRFARERLVATEQMKKEPLGSENIRRAAFWEMLDTNVCGAGYYAFQRLGESVAPADQKMLAALFLQGPESAPLDGASVALQAGHKEFAGVLIEHLRTHNDRAAEWSARWLCVHKQPAVLPVVLEKLKEPDAAVRKWAAFALCWQPSAETVPGLLAAIKAEKVAAVRNEMLTALAQTGDLRGLDVLLVATKGEFEKGYGMEFARGLSRIRDKRALPALAAMLERYPDPQYQSEVVNAFGWVSEIYKGYPAARFWSGSGIEPERLKAGLAEIAKWRQNQPK